MITFEQEKALSKFGPLAESVRNALTVDIRLLTRREFQAVRSFARMLRKEYDLDSLHDCGCSPLVEIIDAVTRRWLSAPGDPLAHGGDAVAAQRTRREVAAMMKAFGC